MRITPLRLIAALLGLAVALVLAAVLYVAFADLSAHKARLETFVSEQTGKPVAIEGAFEVRVLPTILVRAEQLRLGEQLRIGRFLVEVGTGSLLFGPVEVRALELHDATLVVESTGEQAGAPGARALGPIPVLRSASLSNVRVVVRAPGKPERVALVEALQLASSPEGRMNVKGTGRYESPGQKAQLSGPLELEAQFTHAGETIKLKDLRARLGKSELSGRASVELAGRRRIELELASPSLDLTPFLQSAVGGAKSPASKYVFDETPLPLDALAGLDARLSLAAAEVKLKAALLKDFAGKLNIADGAMTLEARANGGISGAFGASASLKPRDKGSAELRLRIDAKELRTGYEASGAIDPKAVPATRVDVKIETRGASARQLAAGTNGRIVVAQGAGRIRAGLIGLLGGDTFGQLSDKLNPFSATDAYSQLECAVVRADIVNGLARLEPAFMQTVKVAVAAEGEIDLRTEALKIGFNTRPREGIGLSAGMVTNPFIAVGGTLAKPSLGVGGTMAAASGAAAIFTGGMSVLAQGLLDRYRGEQDLCADALPAAGR
jgi:uncharacterized protein involved in outer membrane biogenesis